MPIYEFKCNKCDNIFEFLCIKRDDKDHLVCPSCGHNEVEALLSTFSSIGSISESGSSTISSACSSSRGFS